MNRVLKLKITAICMAIIAAIIISCKPEIPPFDVEMTPTPLINVLNIQVLDANPNAFTPIPDDAKVTISGKDAAKLYSLEGSKQFSMSNGFISIGMLRRDTGTLVATPLEFMVTVKAAGYVDGRMNYKISQAQTQIATLKMINKDPNLVPQGVVIQERTVSAAQLSAGDIVLNSGMPTGRTEDAKMTLKQGTKLLDANGNEVPAGPVEITMVSFDAANPGSVASFPGGLNYNAQDSTGSNVGSGSFTTFGFMSLDMSVNGTAIKSFDKPLEISMELKSGTTRSDSAGSTLQAGQEIPVWSLDEKTGEWKAEALASVTSVNGKLTAKFAQKHLSWWNLDDPTCPYLLWWLRQVLRTPYDPNGCRSCGTVNLPIQSPNTTGNINGGTRFYIEILNALSPSDMPLKTFYDDLVNGSQFWLLNNVSEFMFIRFKVYDRPGGTLLNPTTANTTYRPCSRPTINLTAMIIPPVPVTINIDFSALGADCGNPNLLIKPTTTFYYRDASIATSPWLPWGLMKDGVASSSALLRGKSYYFGVFHSKLNFETKRMGVLMTGQPVGVIKIPATQDNQPIAINLGATPSAWGLTGRTIYLKPRNGTDSYDLTDDLTKNTMRRYSVNSYTCEKFKKYF